MTEPASRIPPAAGQFLLMPLMAVGDGGARPGHRHVALAVLTVAGVRAVRRAACRSAECPRGSADGSAPAHQRRRCIFQPRHLAGRSCWYLGWWCCRVPAVAERALPDAAFTV